MCSTCEVMPHGSMLRDDQKPTETWDWTRTERRQDNTHTELIVELSLMTQAMLLQQAVETVRQAGQRDTLPGNTPTDSVDPAGAFDLTVSDPLGGQRFASESSVDPAARPVATAVDLPT